MQRYELFPILQNFSTKFFTQKNVFSSFFDSERGLHLIILIKELLSAAKNAQQIEEEVDEVEIERKCTKQCILLHRLSRIGCLETHLLDLLRVVGGESDKDQHTDIAGNDADARDEDGHDAGND